MVKHLPKNPKVMFVSRWNTSILKECKLDHKGKVVSEKSYLMNKGFFTPMKRTIIPPVETPKIQILSSDEESPQVMINDLIQTSKHRSDVPFIPISICTAEDSNPSHLSVAIINA